MSDGRRVTDSGIEIRPVCSNRCGYWRARPWIWKSVTSLPSCLG